MIGLSFVYVNFLDLGDKGIWLGISSGYLLLSIICFIKLYTLNLNDAYLLATSQIDKDQKDIIEELIEEKEENLN